MVAHSQYKLKKAWRKNTIRYYDLELLPTPAITSKRCRRAGSKHSSSYSGEKLAYANVLYQLVRRIKHK